MGSFIRTPQANNELEMILTFLGIQFIDYKLKRCSNGHVTAKTVGEIRGFFGKEVMTTGQYIEDIHWWDFESDWNDLMFLVKQIDLIAINAPVVWECEALSQEVFTSLREVNLGLTYTRCVNFIELYNQIK